MTAYELFRTIDPARVNELVRAGIVSEEWRRAAKIYEYWQECCKGTGRMDAYDLTGQKFFMSDENVRKIIRRLQKEVG